MDGSLVWRDYCRDGSERVYYRCQSSKDCAFVLTKNATFTVRETAVSGYIGKIVYPSCAFNAVDQPKDREYQGLSNAGEVSRKQSCVWKTQICLILARCSSFRASIGAITKGNRTSEHAVCLATVWTRDVQKERSETVVIVFRNRLLHYGPEIPRP